MNLDKNIFSTKTDKVNISLMFSNLVKNMLWLDRPYMIYWDMEKSSHPIKADQNWKPI